MNLKITKQGTKALFYGPILAKAPHQSPSPLNVPLLLYDQVLQGIGDENTSKSKECPSLKSLNLRIQSLPMFLVRTLHQNVRTCTEDHHTDRLTDQRPPEREKTEVSTRRERLPKYTPWHHLFGLSTGSSERNWP